MNRGFRPRVTSPRLVGREDEVRALVECGTRPSGRVPAVALVSGRAGMGKSRLVEEATTRLRAEGVTVLTGAGLPFGPDGPPYAPLVAALRGALPADAPVLQALTGATPVGRSRLCNWRRLQSRHSRDAPLWCWSSRISTGWTRPPATPWSTC